MMNKLFGRAATAALLAGITVMGSAYAQTPTQTAEPEKIPETQSTPAAKPAAEESIVVTGSRLRRSEFTSSSPVQIITKEAATLEGLVSTAEIIQGSAIAGGTFQTNNQFTGFIAQGGPGGNQVALRGLGSQRTLVLLNGRRIGPAGVRGTVQAVDLNTIPSAIIDRVEVLTDGASSIYGSEALGGVINVITRPSLDRTEFNLEGTLPEQGGGGSFSVDGAWGKVFSKGYVNVSVQYQDFKPLYARDRQYTNCTSDYLFSADRTALVDYTDPFTGQTKCYGLFANVLRTGFGDLFYGLPGRTYPGAAQGNNSPVAGMIRQGRNGFPATFATGNYQDPLFGGLTVLSPRSTSSFYASAGYDLTPSIELYSELLLNKRESSQNGVRQFFPTITSATNPGNVRPDTGASFGANILPIIPLKSNQAQNVDYMRALVGLRGEFGGFLEGWDWDFVGQFSKSDAEYSGDFIYNDRVLATTTSAAACNPTPAGGNISGFSCASLAAPIPWTSQRVLAGQFNQNEAAFLFANETGTTTYEQTYFEATVNGDIMKLPAGAVSGAFGLHYRTEKLDDVPGINAQTSNLWGSTAAGKTKGKDTVKEVFGELEIPLLKGVPLIETLTLNTSGRISDYDSYGKSDTYKIGLNWQIVPWLRARGTTSTSFRAPALFEQFLANQTSFLNQTAVDPCIRWEESSNPRIQANCQAAGVPQGYLAAGTSSALIVAGGGRGILDAETGTAKTVGLIWTPDFLNLNVAVDYWELEVNNQVAQFGAGNIVAACYGAPDYPTNEFCSLFNRNAATSTLRPNEIVQIRNNYVNVASQGTRGIDVNLRYTHDASFGRIVADGKLYWTLEDGTQLFNSSTVNDFLGTSYGFRGPDFSAEANIRYDRKDWTVQWSMDFVGKGSDTEEFGGDVFNSNRYATDCRVGTVVSPCVNIVNPTTGALPAGTVVVPRPVYFKQFNEFTSYHDVTVRKRFDSFSITAGVLNIFNEAPPAASSGQTRFGLSARGNYDQIGRRAYVSMSKRW